MSQSYQVDLVKADSGFYEFERLKGYFEKNYLENFEGLGKDFLSAGDAFDSCGKDHFDSWDPETESNVYCTRLSEPLGEVCVIIKGNRARELGATLEREARKVRWWIV